MFNRRFPKRNFFVDTAIPSNLRTSLKLFNGKTGIIQQALSQFHPQTFSLLQPLLNLCLICIFHNTKSA